MAIPNPTPLSGQLANQLASQSAGQTLQLHDIHTPEQVSNFPIAPGWWILLLLILISAIWLYKKFKQHKQLNAVKNQALATLENNDTMRAKECISLLKWTAMHYFSRQHLAKLYGDSFQQFLIMQLPDKHQNNFTQLTTAGFNGQYQAPDEAKQASQNEQTEQQQAIATADIDRDCQQAAKLWLTHALPVKAVKSSIQKPSTLTADKPTTQPSPAEKEKELSE
ncbi:MAG: DUF4381 domain-containing protein [Colwellia sp.]